jgi:hypothetical protein
MFDDNWESGEVASDQSDDIEFHSSRRISLPVTGTYTFNLGSDDGSRLWVDGNMIIDRWYDTGYSKSSSSLTLNSGNHNFRIDYYDSGWDARVSFDYTYCVNASPTVTLTPNPQTGTLFQPLTYSIRVTNKDSVECGSSRFDLSRACPVGWSCTFNIPSLIVIAPQATDSSATITVTPPASASVGPNFFTVTATKSGFSSYQGSFQGEYFVILRYLNVQTRIDDIDLPISNVQVTLDGSTRSSLNGEASYVMIPGSHILTSQLQVAGRPFTHFWDHDYDNNCNELGAGYNDTANNPHTFTSGFCNRTITALYKVFTAFTNSTNPAQPTGMLNFTGSMISGYLFKENASGSFVNPLPNPATVELSYYNGTWNKIGTASSVDGYFSYPWSVPLGAIVYQIMANYTPPQPENVFPNWFYIKSVGIFTVPNETDEASTCLDRRDNNFNGLIDAADPSCEKNVMNFTGILNYSSGLPVKNSMIKITIGNSTLGYEKMAINQTDDNGRFFIKVMSLPGFMMDTDFDMNIYVLGDIEAIYDCHYSKASGACS